MMNKKPLTLIILLILFSSLALATVEDDFNRPDNESIGIATNGYIYPQPDGGYSIINNSLVRNVTTGISDVYLNISTVSQDINLTFYDLSYSAVLPAQRIQLFNIDNELVYSLAVTGSGATYNRLAYLDSVSLTYFDIYNYTAYEKFNLTLEKKETNVLNYYVNNELKATQTNAFNSPFEINRLLLRCDSIICSVGAITTNNTLPSEYITIPLNTPPTIQSFDINETFVYEDNISISYSINDTENDTTTYLYLDNDLVAINNTNYVINSSSLTSGRHEIYLYIDDGQYNKTSTTHYFFVDWKQDDLVLSDVVTYIDFTQYNSTHYFDSVNDYDIEIVSGTPTNDTVNLNNVNLQSSNYNFLYGQPSTFLMTFNPTAQANFAIFGFNDTISRAIYQGRSGYLYIYGTTSEFLNYQGFNNDYTLVATYNGSHQIIYINGRVVTQNDTGIFKDIISTTTNLLMSGNNTSTKAKFGDVAGGTLTQDIYLKEFAILNKPIDSQQALEISSGGQSYINTLLQPPSQVNIYSPTGSHTLNSTGKDFTFWYDQSIAVPDASYDVYLTNGVFNTSIRNNTFSTNFVESITKNDVLISDNYSIVVVSKNNQGSSISTSSYDLELCVNIWISQYSSCVNDTQIMTYYDANLCNEQYDVPVDNNTIVVCDDGIVSTEEYNARNIEFKENIMITILIGLISLVLIIFYMTTRSSLIGFILTIYFVLLSIYLFYQYPNDWIVGVAGLIVASAFGIASIYMNKE